jgi:hypothetical protein
VPVLHVQDLGRHQAARIGQHIAPPDLRHLDARQVDSRAAAWRDAVEFFFVSLQAANAGAHAARQDLNFCANAERAAG